MPGELPELGHLRTRGEEQRATNLELFFDLVYVFAVTQLSHLLLGDLTWKGAAQTAFLLLVVWWAWIYTTWMTNWFDPNAVSVRVVLIGGMLASLLMAIALPQAFEDRGLLFAGAYVALQVGRNTFGWLSLPRGTRQRHMYLRLVVWSVLSGIFWIAGGLADGDARWALWLIALSIDYVAPLTMYAIPRMGRATTADWPIDGGHFAERFQLFIIIALGESIVVTGATASGLDFSGLTVIAVIVAFLGSAALWWLYFDETAFRSRRYLANHDDSGRLGRNSFTYLHLPIVAGIILTAVGDDLVVAHPHETLRTAGQCCVVGGAAIYLIGHQAFRYSMISNTSHKRWVAIAVILLWGIAAQSFSGLAVAAGVVTILIALVVVETRERLATNPALTG